MKVERQAYPTMLEFLITNAETYTDYKNNATEIHLFGRDTDKNRHHVTVTDYAPHFYVRTSEVEGCESDVLGSEGIKNIDHGVEFDEFGTDKPLSRVEVAIPKNVRPACDLFEQTFGADVTLDNWLRIQQGVKDWCRVPAETCHADDVEPIEAPVDVDPEPRIVTLDIEVDDRGGFPEPGEKRITSIVAHDSYAGEYIGFIDGDGRPIHKMFPEGKPDEIDELHIEADERQMLIKFACWIGDVNPDLLTAWNVDFDAPYLVARMNEVGASAARLSPMKEAYNKRNGTCRIRGRSVYDLLDAYKNNSWGELRSYSLDYVAQEELNEQKIHFEGSFWDLYQNDPETFVNYNARDVRLAVEINDTAGVVEFRDTLRKQIGVTFEQTRNNYQFIEMMARRKLYQRGEVGPTADYGSGGEKYEGAFVFEPHSGVARNVIGIDVESLYPWTMYMLNASPDTRVDPETFDGPVAVAPNGAAFRLDRDGLFKTLVQDALDLKEGYRDKKNAAAPDSDEEAMWAVKYAVAKTVTNSIYGTTGWDKFFLYDRPTAEAVTLAGQKVIKATSKFVDEKTVADVIYGDTDSNYISFPSDMSQSQCVREAFAICDQLEADVYPEVAADMGMNPDDCEWRIDPEMFSDRFFMWGKKKKYAYTTNWKEGMGPDESLDNPSKTIKGSAAKRSDSSRLTRDTEKDVIKAVLSGNEDDIDGLIYEAAKKIDPTDPDWDAIGIPGGIGQPLDEYDTETAQVRAAKNGNELLGTEFSEGSKPMRCYLRPTYFDSLGDQIDVIGYEDADDLRPVQDQLTVDAKKMTDTLLVNPMEELLDAVGVDVHAAVSGQSQTGLGAFV